MKRGPYISRIALTRPIEGDRYLLPLPAGRARPAGGALELRTRGPGLGRETGTGKSTLLEAVAAAWGFNPEGGTRNFRFSTEATHSALWKSLTLTRRGFARDGFFLRAESLYNVATNIDEMDRAPSLGGRVIDSYGGVSLHRQSHGESFLALVENRFGGEGLYLLDEPEAALSPTRQLSLLALLDELAGRSSQFIIATHSPILMALPGAEIFQLDREGVRAVAYRETEHYQITRRFLENPERMLRCLLEKA